jgi:N-methylhydantoinase B
VRVPPVLLYRGGAIDDGTLRFVVANSRTPDERRGDLLAQAGANARGGARLIELAAAHGAPALFEAYGALADYADARVAAALDELPRGEWAFTDELDDDGAGSGPVPIRCTLRITDGAVEVDFTGSAPQTRGGVNAVEAVTRSAACYVLRCLVPADVPVNEGCWRRLRVVAPAASVVNATPPTAVGAGNVECSQRICDALFGAFAQAAPQLVGAASQGTMNNVLVGGVDGSGRPFSYYETIAGGAGAGPWGDGASGVHTNMTNTRNTPVEALEHAYPFHVVAYELREGSGGAGEHRGGDGVIREFEVLCPSAVVTLVGERRRRGPWGLAGGRAGAPGRDAIAGEPVPAKVVRAVDGSTRVRVETPGGGGWGRPRD